MHYLSKIKLSLFLNTLLIPLVIIADEQEKKADLVRKYYSRPIISVGDWFYVPSSYSYQVEDCWEGLDARKNRALYSTPLNEAVDRDNLEDAKILLDKTINPEERRSIYKKYDHSEDTGVAEAINPNQLQPLVHGIEKSVYPIQLVRSLEMITLLAKYGADMNSASTLNKDHRSLTALGRAIRWYYSAEMVQELLKHGAFTIDLENKKTFIQELEDLKADQNNPVHKAERDQLIEVLEVYKKKLGL
ncbi:hypothetical protein HYX58_02105 [Candidatus Dependentiae bacterium]|nr:hypothetical protein [Candidatus Dependentiae bacterium]